MIITKKYHLMIPYALFILFLKLMILTTTDGLHAQNVYTQLTNKESIQKFSRVNKSLICQCGCEMVLYNCPHVECHWGIPSRRFIENRILVGETEEKIVQAFLQGFTRSQLDAARSQNVDIEPSRYDELKEGYGNKILAKKNPLPMLFLVSFGFFSITTWLMLRWRRNWKKQFQNKKSNPEKLSSLNKNRFIDR